MAIVSRAILKSDWLNIPVSDTTHDAMLDRIIEMVADEIEGICNQPIAQRSVTYYFRGNNRQVVSLPYSTDVTLTSVAYRNSPEDAWTTASNVYALDIYGNKSLYISEIFSASFYRMIADVGYSTIPDDVQLCAFEMCKEVYYETPFAAQAERFGVSVITENDAGMAFAKTLQAMRGRVTPRLSRYVWYGI